MDFNSERNMRKEALSKQRALLNEKREELLQLREDFDEFRIRAGYMEPGVTLAEFANNLNRDLISGFLNIHRVEKEIHSIEVNIASIERDMKTRYSVTPEYLAL